MVGLRRLFLGRTVRGSLGDLEGRVSGDSRRDAHVGPNLGQSLRRETGEGGFRCEWSAMCSGESLAAYFTEYRLRFSSGSLPLKLSTYPLPRRV